MGELPPPLQQLRRHHQTNQAKLPLLGELRLRYQVALALVGQRPPARPRHGARLHAREELRRGHLLLLLPLHLAAPAAPQLSQRSAAPATPALPLLLELAAPEPQSDPLSREPPLLPPAAFAPPRTRFGVAEFFAVDGQRKWFAARYAPPLELEVSTVHRRKLSRWYLEYCLGEESGSGDLMVDDGKRC